MGADILLRARTGATPDVHGAAPVMAAACADRANGLRSLGTRVLPCERPCLTVRLRRSPSLQPLGAQASDWLPSQPRVSVRLVNRR